jgi:hypothetical protein
MEGVYNRLDPTWGRAKPQAAQLLHASTAKSKTTLYG